MSKALVVLSLLAGTADADPKPGSCEATAKAMGKTTNKLVEWKPPASCAKKGGDRTPRSLTTEVDTRTPPPTIRRRSSLDFTKRQLIVTARSYSPAQVGFDVYDDGKQVTFVSRQRVPCKNEHPPMPSPPITLLYQAAPGARTFADASCNISTACP